MYTQTTLHLQVAWVYTYGQSIVGKITKETYEVTTHYKNNIDVNMDGEIDASDQLSSSTKTDIRYQDEIVDVHDTWKETVYEDTHVSFSAPGY
ncbi:hypothetical protein VQ7734_03588 [Vibrio quintilis]|uniref:Uncharacterized protein n=1 Tax=Vibrio quintilis TaxID=1117707 RepID=A0A1M7YYU6_9VIBR|nr:hypothetical protein VQ7734_03588 [Vibrio quintilis]